MKITIREQVLRGNFAGDTDEENQAYAERYAAEMESKIQEYCNERYPLAETTIDFYIERASGCSAGLDITVDNASEDDDEFAIISDIESQCEFIQDAVSRGFYEE